MTESKKMKWQKDLETFFPIYDSFIFEGHIDDDQPFEDEDGQIKYCKLYEYFDKVYTHHADKEYRKRVIVYDPTESEDKRFKICDEDCSVEQSESEDGDEGEPKSVIKYHSSQLSQRFWDILHDDDISKLMIDHKSSGTSLDFSRIHYALTEKNGRINPLFDIMPPKVLEAFNKLFFHNPDDANGYLIVIKMTSRLLSRDGSSGGLNSDELMIFRQLLNLAQSLDSDNDDAGAHFQKNKLIILANQIKDLPMWFTDEAANPAIKLITVSKPSEENKLDFFGEMLEDSQCFNSEFLRRYRDIDAAAKEKDPNNKRNPVQKKFLAYTNDFSMNMLRKYRVYAAANQINDPAKIGFSISKFQAGDLTNPWDDEERIKDMLNIKNTVRKKIQGQDFALDAAQSILTRAAVGLDRAENPNAPRVVLFLAGPTGTGKTELCKQIAECIFGSEDRIVRFDMSEYKHEESDQKLFGAPPGYIGYEEGGKLTNAIKKEPFSLVLFDEVEKAHNSILDKFLQILGDGRLTDGRGDTVRFTDCIIVITSNAGVLSYDGMTKEEIDKRMNGDAKPEGEMTMERVIELESQKGEKLTEEDEADIYAQVREHLRYNVKSYFHCKLERPELYGRIEDSIVYYNYIGKEAVPKIVNSKISDVIKSTTETMNVNKIECSSEVKAAIAKFCQDCRVRALGARGIIKNTGKLFTGSLSAFLSDYVRGVGGKRKSDLAGKTLACSCKENILSAEDIRWSIL